MLRIADKCLLGYVPFGAAQFLKNRIVFLQMNDRNEYVAAIRGTLQYLFRPLIQKLAAIAPLQSLLGHR